MTCGIYMIKNEENGKVYIGQSSDILNRWKQHISDLDKGVHPGANIGGFQWDWIHYGAENFTFKILIKCDNDKKLLYLLEGYYIDKYNSVATGYNIQPSAYWYKKRINEWANNNFERRFTQLTGLVNSSDIFNILTSDEIDFLDEFSENLFACNTYNEDDYPKYIELITKIANINEEFGQGVFTLIDEVIDYIKGEGKNDNQ